MENSLSDLTVVLSVMNRLIIFQKLYISILFNYLRNLELIHYIIAVKVYVSRNVSDSSSDRAESWPQ